MEYIDAKGLPCPMPVVKVKKAFEKDDVDAVSIKVDNFIAVQNLEKMALGLGYEIAHEKVSDFAHPIQKFMPHGRHCTLDCGDCQRNPILHGFGYSVKSLIIPFSFICKKDSSSACAVV